MFEHPLRVAFRDPEILREDPRRSANSFRQSVPGTRVKTCVGQDSNLGTPSGRDLESLAFDQAWLPTRLPATRPTGVKPFPFDRVRRPRRKFLSGLGSSL